MYIFPNGKVYIGTTKHDLATRRDNGYSHNLQLKEAMREYGWRNIQKVILRQGLTQEEAFSAEIEEIAAYAANDPRHGYNISGGGKATFRGLKHTDEYKKSMSALNSGKVFSQSAIDNMRKSHAKERKPVVAVADNGEELKRYASLGDAAADVGGYRSNITRACQNFPHKYKGVAWAFVKGGD